MKPPEISALAAHAADHAPFAAGDPPFAVVDLFEAAVEPDVEVAVGEPLEAGLAVEIVVVGAFGIAEVAWNPTAVEGRVVEVEDPIGAREGRIVGEAGRIVVGAESVVEAGHTAVGAGRTAVGAGS